MGASASNLRLDEDTLRALLKGQREIWETMLQQYREHMTRALKNDLKQWSGADLYDRRSRNDSIEIYLYGGGFYEIFYSGRQELDFQLKSALEFNLREFEKDVQSGIYRDTMWEGYREHYTKYNDPRIFPWSGKSIAGQTESFIKRLARDLQAFFDPAESTNP